MYLLFPVTTINKIEQKQEANKSVCQCGHNAFIFGGIVEYGITTIMCCNCNEEYNIKTLDIQFNIYRNEAPLYSKIPTKCRLYLRQDDTFKTGPIVIINDKAYYLPIEKLINAYGQDYCRFVDGKMQFFD